MASSDDDSFQGSSSSKKKNKRPSPASYKNDDDSDSDDSLLLGTKPTFRSSSRLRNKKPKTKMDAHLEDALKTRSIKMETKISMHRKIQQVKQETNLQDDELLESARAFKVKRDADRREREKEKEQQVQHELQMLQQTVSPDGSTSNAPRRRNNDLWLEVRDTELTRSIDSHFGLRYLPKNRNLPDSTQKAYEYLEFVLEDKTFCRTKIGKALQLHLKRETLDDFMVHKRLNMTVLAEDTKSISNSFLRWMLEVAVATTCSISETNNNKEDAAFGKLSRGAYQTLVELWSTGKGMPIQGSILAISDLPVQLEEWFGIDLVVSMMSSDEGNKANPKSPTSVATLHDANTTLSTIQKPLASVSIIRFLHLWQLALEHNMVYFGNDDDDKNKNKKKDYLSDSILSLLLVSLDPLVFESIDTLASCQPSDTLRQILGHLLETAAAKKKRKNITTWMSHLATRILNHVASGGRRLDNNNNNNNNDTTPSTPTVPKKETVWSDQARVVRVLCHTKGSCVLVAHLCERLVAQVLDNNDDDDDKKKKSSLGTSYWDTTIHKELGNLQGWSAFATISGVVFRLVEDLPNQGATNVPAALVELLVEAMIMALGRLEIGVRGGSSSSTGSLDTASKYAFFHLLDTVLVELTAKSKALTANNPHYLKVNYHASCFRQYTRLETQKYKITEQQSTLDGYFTKNK